MRTESNCMTMFNYYLDVLLLGWFTLVIHANTAGVETDIMLIFIAFMLHDSEQHTILHLQPEFTVFVFQYCFILLKGKTAAETKSNPSTKHFIMGQAGLNSEHLP